MSAAILHSKEEHATCSQELEMAAAELAGLLLESPTKVCLLSDNCTMVMLLSNSRVLHA